ncbi:MAG: head-tail connector protein [Motiliproteus sp.]|nr:head-tail connector protein [Motiliproteus sp.]MCW9051235.1 head-tail connector protein [Motiliproteus sp.]
MTFIIKTEPTEEPVDLSEAKDHIRPDSDSGDDVLISGLIKSARQQVEEHIGRPLMSQSWTLYADGFSDLELKPWTTGIDVIRYMDTDNAQQTLAASVYELRKMGLTRSVGLQYSQDWPSVLPHPGSVEVDFTAGYASAEDVPQPIKQAMLLMVGHLYEFREAAIAGVQISQVPMAYEALLAPYKIPVIG